ncbi:MAG: hypothetical protein VB081_03800 [Christensenella sp.]|uniref:hypothetical protein n=1 Tax=Christensenella sp. TaxID=1935934 RepID=UPI002B212392|nr:hypothetical protein [Christensenella sp.]MEA5002601.1 hypothetical protein [Christensenella sp.]
MGICIPSLRATLAKTSEANTASRLRIQHTRNMYLRIASGILLPGVCELDGAQRVCCLSK